MALLQARVFGGNDAAPNAGAFLGVGDEDVRNPNVGGFGKGTPARRGLIIWGASVGWLFLVWRAVEGY